MNASSKFVVATHILTGLAGKKQYFEVATVKSEVLAESCNTNPVVVRRLVGDLSKAGLILSKSGPNGGALLAKDPDDITLADVYKAVEEKELFHFHYQQPSAGCPVGANIQSVLGKKLGELTKIIIEYLSTISIKEIMDDTLKMSGVLDHLAEGLSPEQIEEKIMKGEIIVKKG